MRQFPQQTKDVEQRIQTICQQHADKSLVVGYSGGVDSTVLLYLTQQYARVKALYIDHAALFANDGQKQHCHNWCKQHGIALQCITLPAPTESGNREHMARTLRYRAFANALQANQLLLLAHHLDDQIETVLLRLNRGSGMRGLTAIARSRKLGKSMLLRPLLTSRRSAICAVAEKYRLRWFEDSSNSDTSSDRNYLRHTVLPHMHNRWQTLALAWQHSVQTFCQQHESLLWFCQRELNRITKDGALSVVALAGYPLASRRQLVLAWINQHADTPPGYRVLATIEQQLLGAVVSPSARVQVPQRNGTAITLARYQNYLYLITNSQPETGQYNWDGRAELQLASGTLRTLPAACGGIALPKEPWTVCFRKGGEKIRVNQHHTSIKKLYQQRRIPAWQRNHPLIYCGNTLLAVAGVAVSSHVRTKKGVRILWQPRLRG